LTLIFRCGKFLEWGFYDDFSNCTFYFSGDMLRLGEKMIRFNKVRAVCLEVEGTLVIVDVETGGYSVHNFITNEIIVESELDNELNLTVMQ
jgi:hypothetical protein